jgi:ubiquitin fusion degradation protein 1
MDFKSLKAFSIKNGDNGDKIILPSTILDTIIELDIQFPITFEIISKHYKTHCGVIEFTSDEGTCFIPEWIMKNLDIHEGDFIYIRNVSLSNASFIKFKPELKFLELSDPRAVLEYILRSFSCVTIGDKLHFNYNFKEYILEIIEVKPKNACCIIDADIEVEFDEPDGYIPQKMVFT